MKRQTACLIILSLIASSAAAEFVPGEVIVKLKPRVGVSAAGTTSRSLFDKYRAREIKQIFPPTSGIRAAGVKKNGKIAVVD